MKDGNGILFALLLSAATGFGQSTILWNEAVNGPLSVFWNNPTPLGALVLGTNTILGATQIEPTGNNYLVHEDIFTFSVLNGTSLSSIYVTVDKPRVGSWVGDTGFTAPLGYTGNTSNGELFAQWQMTSIGAGAYGMLVGNYDNQPFINVANYRLDFVVQAIPEPASLWLLLGGLGWLGFCGYGRRTLRPQS